MVSIRVRLFGLLREGHCQSSAAKLLKVSKATVRKYIRKMEQEGLIERVCKYPATYQLKRQIGAPLKPVGDWSPPSSIPSPIDEKIMLPAKFGASFFLVGRPPLRYDRYGKAFVKTPGWTLQFGRHKLVIWLHAFRGQTVKELEANARSDILSLADAQGRKLGIQVALDRFFEDVEWVDTSKERSDQVAQAGGFEDGQKVVAGAIHKHRDFSHPENMQFNALPGGDPKRPTEHAQIHEYLYSGNLFRDMHAMAQTIDKLGDSMVAVRARMENKL